MHVYPFRNQYPPERILYTATENANETFFFLIFLV